MTNFGVGIHSCQVIHGKTVLRQPARLKAASGTLMAGHAEIVEEAANSAGELGDGGADGVIALGLDQVGQDNRTC